MRTVSYKIDMENCKILWSRVQDITYNVHIKLQLGIISNDASLYAAVVMTIQ